MGEGKLSKWKVGRVEMEMGERSVMGEWEGGKFRGAGRGGGGVGEDDGREM